MTSSGLPRRVALLALTLVLVGCGGSGTRSTSPPSKAQLDARLLTVSDVGATWKAGQPINELDLAAVAQAPCESVKVDAGVVKRLTAVTGVQFEPAEKAYQHLIELVVTGDAAQLDRDLAALSDAITSCRTATPAVTVTSVNLPALGSQREAYAIRQGKTVLVRAGYVRVGSLAVMVGLADFAAPGGVSGISDATFVSLLSAAVQKLQT